MTPLIKVGIAAGVGVTAASFLEPMVVEKLPASLKTDTTGKIVHGVIVGVVAMATYYVIGKAG